MTTPVYDPTAEYIRRLAAREAAHRAYDTRFDRIANARLAVFVLAVIIGAGVWRAGVAYIWLAVPGMAFIGLVVWHEMTSRAAGRARAAADHYRRGLSRLEGSWPGGGVGGEHWQKAEHPYAPDLDLFGEASLFELLCEAQTRAGERHLATWMQEPQSAGAIRARQEAVAELTGYLDLREDLGRLGAEVRRAVRGESLARWAMREVQLPQGWQRVGALVLSCCVIVALIVAYQTNIIAPLFLLLTLQLVVLNFVIKPMLKIVAVAEEPARELRVLANLLIRVEQESFKCTYLRDIQERLREGGQPVSARIRQLERLVYLFELQGNQLFWPVALLLMWGVHVAFAMESWRAQWGRHLPDWLEAVGEFEALLSLAGFAWEHPDYPFPTIVEGAPQLEGMALVHPLLKRGACVANDVLLGGDLRVTIVSGSNMSGKSTYLRVVGINVILAQLGAPVAAASLRLTPFQIGATLRVQDSIQGGVSRFYAELRRLKAVADLIDGEVPVLFLLDEILHGTNSHDRQIGAEALVKSFVERGAVGFVTTHDLALTRAADAMGSVAINVHFADHFDGVELRFDYTMHPGVVTHSNALQLMAKLGLLPPQGDGPAPDATCRTDATPESQLIPGTP